MMEDVIGLVPAAGKGQRLNLPYPKELYPVIRDNRYTPVVQFVLENLRAAAVRHVVVVINETIHQLIGYFGDGHRFGLEISYVVQEQNGSQGGSTSPGLAGALDCSYHLTRNKTVLFGMPDTVMEPVNVFELLLRSSDSEDDASLALFPTTRPEKFGMVRLDDRDRVLEVVDKPRQTNLVDMWGCILWRPRFTEHLRTCLHGRGIADFAQIINTAIQEGLKVRGTRMPSGTYRDLGTYEEITDFKRSGR
jgi:glucose-1-phosphate thymidylyltransferase